MRERAKVKANPCGASVHRGHQVKTDTLTSMACPVAAPEFPGRPQALRGKSWGASRGQRLRLALLGGWCIVGTRWRGQDSHTSFPCLLRGHPRILETFWSFLKLLLKYI